MYHILSVFETLTLNLFRYFVCSVTHGMVVSFQMYCILSVFETLTLNLFRYFVCSVTHGIVVSFHSYALYDLYTQHSFVVDLQLSVCWETYQDCVMTVNILQKMFLPKKQCTGKAGFEVPCE